MAAPELDEVFSALSDATRRDVVERLTHASATVSELAEPYGMSLPGFMKHLRVLEQAGLLVRAKEGRTVRCELAPQALQEAAMWLSEQTQPGARACGKTSRSSASPAATPLPAKKSGGRGPSRKR